MNYRPLLTLVSGVALLLMFAAHAFPQANHLDLSPRSIFAGTSVTYQVAAHAVHRSGYIVASS